MKLNVLHSVHCAVQNTNFQNGKNKVGEILNNRPSFCTQMDSGEKEKDRYLSVVKLCEKRESHETTVKVTWTPSVEPTEELGLLSGGGVDLDELSGEIIGQTAEFMSK